MFCRVLVRELHIAFRRREEVVNPLWFFLIVITLFPLGVGSEPALLSRIAPGVVWVAALLSAVLALERLFHDDANDGSLEQLLLMPASLSLIVVAKVVAHWLITGLPLLLFSPLAALLLSMDFNGWWVMAATLLLGTPVLSFLGALGVALTVGIKRGSALLALLVLPLSVPVLIFATLAMAAAAQGMPVGGYLAVLGALLIVSALLTPFATAAALRLSVQ